MGTYFSSTSSNSITTTAAVTNTITVTSSTDDDDEILAGALSAILGKEILPHSNAQQSQTHQLVSKVSLFDQHQASFVYGKVGSGDKFIDGSLITLNITILSSKNTFTCSIEPNSTVDKLKRLIYIKEGLLCDKQNLIYCGQEIDDGHLLSEYGIQDSSTILVVRLRKYNANDLLVLDQESRDSGYDYDFTHVQDKNERFYRGGIEYRRPCGWKRYAIKVLGRYENDDWLGSGNSSNEWPVSYHGTKHHVVQSIAHTGYDLKKGVRSLHGPGIYSSPNINVAKGYATKFSVNNNRYCVVLQNRVNPKTLIKLTASEVGDQGEYWISPDDRDIRPYGYCIMKI